MRKIILGAALLNSVYFIAQQKPAQSTDRDIEAVNITKAKKAVEQRADRTIFDFSEQPQLNTGTAMEGIKKLPGLIVSDVAGMLYQGKPLDVYMDGRPLNISSNELSAFLEGLPANSIERIEVITQPGAEFPATSGGAILNIITSKTAKNYLTATYSGNYTFTNYEKLRSRTNNSLLLNARNKWFGWQLNFGQNYRESMLDGFLDELSTTFTDRIGRGYFTKAAATFELGADRLLLNYDLNHNNNHNRTESNGIFQGQPYTTDDLAHSLNLRHAAVATYQKKFEDKNKKLDFKLTYNNASSDFEQNNLNFGVNMLENSSSSDNWIFKSDYSQGLKILDEGKVSVGALYETQNFDTESKGIQNLIYERQTISSYIEFQAKLKKFDFIAGTRAENYDISGTTNTGNLTPYNQFKLFPNASLQYNFMKQVYFNLNYNKKITLPSISALNPNNTTYENANVTTAGNPNLRPTIYDNFEAKISAFDYAFLGYNLSSANNQVIQKLIRNGDRVENRQENVEQLKIHNFNLGLPVPFMLFTKPFKEVMAFNFNPDKINFMYLYTGYQWHEMPAVDTKGFWIFNVMTQFILPQDVKLVANYSYLTKNGNYYYFVSEKPFNDAMSLTISKKFMKDRLNVSLFANDIFNTQEMRFRSVAQEPHVTLGNKFDTQNFGLSLNYKIPTKNKLAKEDPNLLNREKKEDGGILQQGD